MEVLIYIGKVSLYWILFYTCYLLFLRKHTFFVWNRLFLLGSLIISFALPFIIYPAAAPGIPAFYEVNASAITISSVQENSLFTLANVLWSVYVLGALIMAYKFYTHIRQLKGFLAEGELIELEDCKVVMINSNHIGSFSFLKWIVVNRNDYEHHFDAILRHEMVHMQQNHSLDVLLIETLKIVFWFNPILILYKKSLQEVHEFLADSEAPNKENYATFLVAYALNAPVASLTNHFFNPSQIKTRIQMIYKNRTSKWLLSTYLMVFATIGIVALLVAGCERQESENFTDLETFKARDTKAENFEAKKIFTVVEQQPEFPGGVKEMYKFLGQNIKFPEAAVKANVSGRVFLSFVVSETGDISDILVLKGIGFGCDAEAIRVLKSFPKWEPGKQNGIPVNVRYNLPINFQIDDEEKESSVKVEKGFKNDDGSAVSLLTNGRVLEETQKNDKNFINITSTNPLYIVDGKIEEDPDLLKSKIKPENIASVSVLKDQNAIEKYGEIGKNGVILITTK